MYKKILVPLDGSKLAECVLEHIEQIAKGCNTEEVILVSVTERVTGHSIAPEVSEVYGSDVPITIGKMQRQAEKYLGRIAGRLAKKGISNVQTAVLRGNPAEEIVHYAQENDCGLITMASHGRSGISRWAYGSVADKILRASPVPVLIVKAPGSVSSI